MFRTNTEPTNITNVNCFIQDAGMGDYVCFMSPIKYIEDTFPWVNLLIWVPDYFVDFAKHLLSPTKFTIRGHSQWEKKGNKQLQGISTAWGRGFDSLSTHPILYGFYALCDRLPDINSCNYLQIKPELIKYDNPTSPYVVIPVGSTARVKELSAEVINEIAKFVKSKGYTPVFIGKKTNNTGTKGFNHVSKIQEVDFSLGINLIDKCSLLETAKLISGAKCIVGVDGGPIHIAGTTQTKIVAAYTFIDPDQGLPIRNNELGWNCYSIGQPSELECRYCQTNWNFMDHTFTKCYYDDYACVNNLTSDKFNALLCKIL